MSESHATTPGYDTSRVHVAGIFWFVGGFLVTLVLLLYAVWWFEKSSTAGRGLPALAAPEEEQPLQPSLHHPSSAAEDMAQLRAGQMARLHGADPGRHEIPIEQAMDELLKSGALTKPWKNPATQPFVRPPNEPARPSVENRT